MTDTVTKAMTDDAAAVRDLALATLGLPETWTEPEGYPDSLALSAIDSVFSLNANYGAVENILRRYRALRRNDGADPNTDDGSDLLSVVEALGGPEAATRLFGRNPAPGTTRGKKGPVLKTTALVNGVQALAGLGINTSAELRSAPEEVLAAGERAWCAVRGLGEVSWTYLTMHAGVQGVKADKMVRRFVTRAVGSDRLVSASRAKDAVERAADSIGVTRRTLDHRIWRGQSGRD
jgi:hypothetical protein